ncbi:glycosyltransferase family 2 protein [Myxococcota bacterium]|nr:glycosyltransferase family 2 protein [Myxococcota bacterium]
MQPPQDVYFSIVVPAYNEAERLPETLSRMARYLTSKPFSSELIVVDDGSTDGTFLTVQQLAARLPVPIAAYRYEKNRGKGFALKVGFEKAVGRYQLFTDADLSTPIEEADRFLEALESGIGLVVGSRRMQGAEVVVRQPWLRESMGVVFTAMVRHLFVDVSDITCGFKGFRADVATEIFPRLRIADWSFDAELLFLAHRFGFPIREVPVRWRNHSDTKVAILRASIMSLWGLLLIRLNSLRGVYREPLGTEIDVEEWRSSG